jgi:hypothetical protein
VPLLTLSCAQLAEAYRSYRRMNEECLGVQPTPENSADLDALASLFSAAADGIAIQTALDPDGYDPAPAFAMLERAFRLLLPEPQSS